MIVFFDLETDRDGKKILDIGAVREDGASYHGDNLHKFARFIDQNGFLCGHNIIFHDLQVLSQTEWAHLFLRVPSIDTLFLSPLLFPKKPYHSLVKDDKLDPNKLGNPLCHSKIVRELYTDEVLAFRKMDKEFQEILFALLHSANGFSGFFKAGEFGLSNPRHLSRAIFQRFENRFCQNSQMDRFIHDSPIELAYTLAYINAEDTLSATPPWLLLQFPKTHDLLIQLRSTPCSQPCPYCANKLDTRKALRHYFRYDDFRSFDGVPLQKQAVDLAVHSESLLAIFPTGGGKSLTFQLPALMAGDLSNALTVVLSPLQSLMKDQVDNLMHKKEIFRAVTINSQIDPIQRSQAIEMVEDGTAQILYISPESLRSTTIRKLLLKRRIARFVIDEAHCLSAWGQDFRVDYLYIAPFIAELCEKKNLKKPIPVSCFTATAKPKVIDEILEYFQKKLGLSLKIVRTNSGRKNLAYKVITVEDDQHRFRILLGLLHANKRPTIIYVSRTKRSDDLAEKLTNEGFRAIPFHGQMDSETKARNQDLFIQGKVNIIVATTAFGMGVDKSDVGMVIHYNISNSLENYIQEAGRAGRDERIQAECYILFQKDDIDGHLQLINTSKLDIRQIQQLWKSIKNLTSTSKTISQSALEMARAAGWPEELNDLETHVKTALSVLEEAKYIKRDSNSPVIYANSISVRTFMEGQERILADNNLSEKEKQHCQDVLRKLIASRWKKSNDEAEERVEYIADSLGINLSEVMDAIQNLKDMKILADAKELHVTLKKNENWNKLSKSLRIHFQWMSLLFQHVTKDRQINIKMLTEEGLRQDIQDSAPKTITVCLNFWCKQGWTKKRRLDAQGNLYDIQLRVDPHILKRTLDEMRDLTQFILYDLHKRAEKSDQSPQLFFSIQEVIESYHSKNALVGGNIKREAVEQALLFLSYSNILTIDGGFLVIHNRIRIQRIEQNPKKRFLREDYNKLETHYRMKIEQVHMIAEYAQLMLENYQKALKFLNDYFTMSYEQFLRYYFPAKRREEIRRPVTPEKFRKIFGALSTQQMSIINDSQSDRIIVLAGPGSGKTRVLVHKLASLLLLEDVKPEQLLMLSFSRSAVNVFRERLKELVGPSVRYVQISTFHSYCLDLLGRVGNLENMENVIRSATEEIRKRNVEESKIAKSVIVLDEAQDMDKDQFDLVSALLEANENARLIAVGDDDQNIYSTLRKSDSRYFARFLKSEGAKSYELMDNFRSPKPLVHFANALIQTLPNRMKSRPIVSRSDKSGIVEIHKYPDSTRLFLPVLNHLKQNPPKGQTAILVRTNRDAHIFHGLLNQHGIRNSLIRSDKGFRLSSLMEIRLLKEMLFGSGNEQIVRQEEWERRKKRAEQVLSTSPLFSFCKSVVETFERISIRNFHLSDWEDLTAESRLSDFSEKDGANIHVSTMHGSKGREFDSVYFVYPGKIPAIDEEIRLFYVALTRAKSELRLFVTFSWNYPVSVPGARELLHDEIFPFPDRLGFQLGMKDVWLDQFIDNQEILKNMEGGARLKFIDASAYDRKGNRILMLSKSFKSELANYQKDGFQLTEGKATYRVFWRKQNHTDSASYDDILIVLPEIELRRESLIPAK